MEGAATGEPRAPAPTLAMLPAMQYRLGLYTREGPVGDRRFNPRAQRANMNGRAAARLPWYMYTVLLGRTVIQYV